MGTQRDYNYNLGVRTNGINLDLWVRKYQKVENRDRCSKGFKQIKKNLVRWDIYCISIHIFPKFSMGPLGTLYLFLTFSSLYACMGSNLNYRLFRPTEWFKFENENTKLKIENSDNSRIDWMVKIKKQYYKYVKLYSYLGGKSLTTLELNYFE